jgi:hypothetical protein
MPGVLSLCGRHPPQIAGGSMATARKTPAKRAAAKKAPAKKVAKKAAPRRITAKKALANTRKLLEAKHRHDRETPPWQALDERHPQVPQPGFQSDEARTKAVELHAAESRLEAIQGSTSTVGRHNQGKLEQR